MQYMISFYESTKEIAKREDPAQAEAYWGAWHAYIGKLQQSGAVVHGNGLQPPHMATRVSSQGGKRHVQDGPQPDAKEHLGGYFIIEVKDLDAAMELASGSPNTLDGFTEIRPVLPPPNR